EVGVAVSPPGKAFLADTENESAEATLAVSPPRLCINYLHSRLGQRHDVWSTILASLCGQLDCPDVELRQHDRIGNALCGHCDFGDLRPAQACDLVGSLPRQHQQLNDLAMMTIACMRPNCSQCVICEHALTRRFIRLFGGDDGIALDAFDAFRHAPGEKI